MRLPRNLGPAALVEALKKLGYGMTRQTGSHVRLTSTAQGAEHHVTIPKHSPVRVGTLSKIVNDVAKYLKLGKKVTVERLFK